MSRNNAGNVTWEFKEDVFLQDLKRLVEFPSISSDPSFSRGVIQCARHLKTRLERLGAESSLVETSGYPLVVARVERSPEYPTVAFYNHYDVQPVAFPDEWHSNPFKLRVKDGRYFGRGSSDDKGNLVVGIHAVEAALRQNVPLNFAFIVEGEEESGSINFKQGLRRVKNTLKPDCVVVLDSKWLSRDRPCIKYGMRGLLYMHWTLQTNERPGHSGTLGGLARNPLSELMAAAMKCYDPGEGRILIPGIYDSVKQPAGRQLKMCIANAPSAAELKKYYKLGRIRAKNRKELVERVWLEPSFEIHGCVGGYMKKDGKMTIIPHEGQLLASMRLVPEQNADEIFGMVKQYVSGLNPDIRITNAQSANPYRSNPDTIEIKAAVNALGQTFGRKVLKQMGGETVGALSVMHEELRQPPLFSMAFSLAEHNSHGPNEFYDRNQAEGGIKTLLRFFNLISRRKAVRN